MHFYAIGPCKTSEQVYVFLQGVPKIGQVKNVDQKMLSNCLQLVIIEKYDYKLKTQTDVTINTYIGLLSCSTHFHSME